MSMNPLQHFIIPQYDNHNTVQSISVMVADMTDSAIVAAIIEAAKESGVTDLYLMDKQFIADALREKAEREDPKPLTLDELKQMNGEPVWIWNKSQKPTCVLCVFGQFQQEPLFVNYDFVKEDSTHIVKYDRIKKWGYRFYRHKPKEVIE